MYSIIIVVMENEDFIWVVNETEHFDPMPMWILDTQFSVMYQNMPYQNWNRLRYLVQCVFVMPRNSFNPFFAKCKLT